MVPLFLVPLLLFCAWFIGDGLIDGPSPDLGAPVVVTGETVATTTTAFSDPATSTTVIDDGIPGIEVAAAIEPELPQGAGSPTLYPTCPAGRDGDGSVVDAENDVDDIDDSDAGAIDEPGDDPLDDAVDDARDRLDDLCDE